MPSRVDVVCVRSPAASPQPPDDAAGNVSNSARSRDALSPAADKRSADAPSRGTNQSNRSAPPPDADDGPHRPTSGAQQDSSRRPSPRASPLPAGDGAQSPSRSGESPQREGTRHGGPREDAAPAREGATRETGTAQRDDAERGGRAPREGTQRGGTGPSESVERGGGAPRESVQREGTGRGEGTQRGGTGPRESVQRDASTRQRENVQQREVGQRYDAHEESHVAQETRMAFKDTMARSAVDEDRRLSLAQEDFTDDEYKASWLMRPVATAVAHSVVCAYDLCLWGEQHLACMGPRSHVLFSLGVHIGEIWRIQWIGWLLCGFLLPLL